MLIFLQYIGLSLVLLVAGIFIFELSTKNKEFDLIFNKGNKTAAYVLGGKALGLALILESSLRNSISLLDLLIWGLIGIATQVVVYIIADLLTPIKFYDAVEEDKRSVGLALFFLSITIGLVISGALTY